jgi:hypothetical protein
LRGVADHKLRRGDHRGGERFAGGAGQPPRPAVQLAAIQRRLRDYAKAAIREEATDPAAGLLRDIAGLHSEMASLATESASGSMRSAPARTGIGRPMSQDFGTQEIMSARMDFLVEQGGFEL